jgi:ABC-2 type transport system permease protein
MSTEPNAIEGSPAGPDARTHAAVPVLRRLFWSVRRELWENRSIYVAPVSIAIAVLIGFFIRTMALAHTMRDLSALPTAEQRAAIEMPYEVAAFLIIVTAYLVGVFYSLDALHGERRDRSILFWKSLPVSDLTTVVSKAILPVVILPLLAYVIILPTQLIMFVQNSASLMMTHRGADILWNELPLFQMALVLLYGLVVHALWHAPIYAWLLFVSAWQRRGMFLSAVVPPIAIAAVEKYSFGSTYFVSLLKYRIIGAMQEAFAVTAEQRHRPIDSITELDPVRFLTSAGLWLGLVATGALLVAAARMRRHREPS